MKTSILSLSALNFRIGAAVVLVLISNSTMLQAQGTKADYERFDKIGGITGGKVFRDFLGVRFAQLVPSDDFVRRELLQQLFVRFHFLQPIVVQRLVE